MTKIRTLVLVTALMASQFCAAPSVAQEQPSSETLQAAQEFVSVISPNVAAQISAQMVKQAWPPMEAALRNQYPNISAEALNAVLKELQSLHDSYAADMLKDSPAIYARYFTADELRRLIAFYKSPIGTKYMRVTPAVMADVYAVSRQRFSTMQERSSVAMNAILRRYGYVQ